MASAALPRTAPVPPATTAAGLASNAGALAPGRILSQAAAIIALLLLNKAGLPGNIGFFGILLMLLPLGRDWPMKVLTLLFLGLICNQWYVPKSPFWTVARFCLPPIVLLVELADMSRLRVGLTRQGFYRAHLLFVVVSVVLTTLTGYFVHISLLKLVNYTIVTTAIFAGIEIQRSRRNDMCEWFVTLIVVVVVLGLASLPLGIAYNAKPLVREGAASVFNGPLYHSNTMGPFSALMTLYLACVFLFGGHRNRWLCLLLVPPLVYFMRLTQSRTSFAALLAGAAVLTGLSFMLTRRGSIALRMNLPRWLLIAAIAAAFLGVVVADASTGGRLSTAAASFINKGGRSDSLDLDQVLSSRIGRIEYSWENFRQSPWIGIGFEVSTDPWFQQYTTLFYAPVEKGFLPTAILEQSGLIGAFFFLITIATLIAWLARCVNVPGLVMYVTFLVVNCGEVMYFGVAGHGAFAWLLVAGGIMLGQFTVRDVRWPFTRTPRSNTMPALQGRAAA